jgi:hypothetical protein
VDSGCSNSFSYKANVADQVRSFREATSDILIMDCVSRKHCLYENIYHELLINPHDSKLNVHPEPCSHTHVTSEAKTFLSILLATQAHCFAKMLFSLALSEKLTAGEAQAPEPERLRVAQKTSVWGVRLPPTLARWYSHYSP